MKNVTGTYSCYGFYINPWFEGEQYGHYRRITFENIDLRPEENAFMQRECFSWQPPFLFSIGGNIDSLTLRNIYWQHPIDGRPVIRIGYAFGNIRYTYRELPVIQTLLIDGLQVADPDAVTADDILVRGRVERLILRNVIVTRAEGKQTDVQQVRQESSHKNGYDISTERNLTDAVCARTGSQHRDEQIIISEENLKEEQYDLPEENHDSCLLKTQEDAMVKCLILDSIVAGNIDCIADLSLGFTDCTVIHQVMAERVARPVVGEDQDRVIGEVTIL